MHSLHRKFVWALAVACSATAFGQSAEKFVPATPIPAVSGTMELTPAAATRGSEIRVGDLVRWAGDDATGLGPTADLIVDRFDAGSAAKTVTLDAVRETLRDAGVNLATIKFAGSTRCVVARSVAVTAATTAAVVELTDPVAARQAADVQPPTVSASRTATSDSTAVRGQTAVVDDHAAAVSPLNTDCNPFHTLRDRALMDVADRLNLPANQLQLTFDPKDIAALNLSEPAYRFQLDPRRVRDLGKIAWDVTVINGDTSKKFVLTADARAWVRQLVLPQGATSKHVFKDGDLQEKRVLVDRLPDEAPLARKQVVGQEAAYDLKPGQVLSARMIDPVQLVKYGQLVTITVRQGGIELKTVAKAMEAGSYGQSIKVRSDDTKDEYQVTMTGPLAGVVGTAPDAPGLASSGKE